MESINWIGIGTESHDFDPEGDVLLRLVRRCAKDENVEPDSESSSINGDDDEEDPDNFPGSDNVPTQEDTAMDVETISDKEQSNLPLNIPVSMRVSSRHLMLASRVFSVMLDKRKFKEGTTLYTEGSVDIELPEDDPDSWEILLNVIHGHSRLVPRKVSLHTLTQIAVLVNKYEMLDVVEIFSDMWVRRLQRRGLPEDFETCREEVMSWLFISWVFEKPKIFKSITKLIIQRSPHALQDLEYDPPIPDTLLEMIQERRLEAIDNLLTIINDLIATYTLLEPQCQPIDSSSDPVELSYSYACDSMLLGSLVKSAAKLGIFPLPDRPFNGIAFDKLAVGIKNMELKSKCDGNLKGYFVRHACHGVRPSILVNVGVLEMNIGGLDLKDFKKLGSG